MGLFSSKPNVTNHDKAVFELKRQRDLLKKYQLQLQKSIENEKKNAIRYSQEKNLFKAKQSLKRKGYLVHLIQTTEGQLDNLEKMALTIENAVIQQNVIQSLALSNQALKELNQTMPLEKVQLLLEETEEAKLYQEEFNHQLEQFNSNQEEEWELSKELEQLQVKDLEERLPPVPISFPQVPIQEPSTPRREEEKQPSKEAPLEA
ncbi:Charged multivesicular body protein 6 [Coelomomyces lativittatus]|nr:Charged multivesicular body protein 6 [Coelomomyces lativittatus]KAJ1512734.1 Charged multivesicular body protein 6 [Coelomomyces lativittatus]